jgi:DNA-binding CsgD family transcriptional regulator
MFGEQNLPWRQICDYLAEIGIENNITTFCDKSICELGRLIPYDSAILYLGEMNPLQIEKMKTFHLSSQYIDKFLNYYINLDPYLLQFAFAVKPVIAEWTEFRDTEFMIDFFKPEGIQHSLAIPLNTIRGSKQLLIGLHRDGKCEFTERDLLIAGAIQPHLVNFCSLLLNNPKNPSESGLDWKILTKREREILALLGQHCTPAEIATKLLISRRTVEFHIANIYEKLKVRNKRELMLKLTQPAEANDV